MGSESACLVWRPPGAGTSGPYEVGAMRILFANPFFFKDSALERRFRTFYFPLGLLYLAAAAREAAHDVAVFDGTFTTDEEEFADALQHHAPDVVCISSWTTVQPAALRLARMAGEGGLPVVMGGPGPTERPAEYLDDPAVGVVVLGEGERTLVDLLEAMTAGRPLTGVEGLALGREQGGVLKTAAREKIHGLDALPMPARDLIDVEKYLEMWQHEQGYRSLNISMTRGCPDDDCPFCAESVMGLKLRKRGIEDVVEEMRHLQETYTLDRFRLVDDLNRLRWEWLRDLGRAMMDAGVTIPYEGLNTITHQNLPMLAQTRDICHERNEWIPTQGKHGHAPATGNLALLRRRWQEGRLLQGERLEDP